MQVFNKVITQERNKTNHYM